MSQCVLSHCYPEVWKTLHPKDLLLYCHEIATKIARISIVAGFVDAHFLSLFANCAEWILANKRHIPSENLDFGKNYSLMTTIYPLIMGSRAILATEHYLSAAAGA